MFGKMRSARNCRFMLISIFELYTRNLVVRLFCGFIGEYMEYLEGLERYIVSRKMILDVIFLSESLSCYEEQRGIL